LGRPDHKGYGINLDSGVGHKLLRSDFDSFLII